MLEFNIVQVVICYLQYRAGFPPKNSCLRFNSHQYYSNLTCHSLRFFFWIYCNWYLAYKILYPKKLFMKGLIHFSSVLEAASRLPNAPIQYFLLFSDFRLYKHAKLLSILPIEFLVSIYGFLAALKPSINVRIVLDDEARCFITGNVGH